VTQDNAITIIIVAVEVWGEEWVKPVGVKEAVKEMFHY
jgi:hypothetical protein